MTSGSDAEGELRGEIVPRGGIPKIGANFLWVEGPTSKLQDFIQSERANNTYRLSHHLHAD